MTVHEVVPAVAAGRLTTRTPVTRDATMLRDLYLDVLADVDIHTLEPHQRTLLLMAAQQHEAELIRRYPDLTRLTVCVDDVPVGRLMLSSAGTHIRLVDLTLLPHARGLGLGTHLVRELLDEATSAGFTLHAAAAKDGRAIHWLERLGFTQDIDRGHAWDLVRVPD